MSEPDDRTYCLSASSFKTSDMKPVDGWIWLSHNGGRASYCDTHAWDRGPLKEQLAILDAIPSRVDRTLTEKEQHELTTELTSCVWSWAAGMPVEMPELLIQKKSAENVKGQEIDQLWSFFTEKERPAKTEVWCDGGYGHAAQH